MGDEQEAGRYRLVERDDGALFGFAAAATSLKSFLHPARMRLWRASRSENGIGFEREEDDPPRYAFLGVRGCELAAARVQDRVFLEGPYVDPHYAARRADCLIIAVNCGSPAGTCFCVSMGTGPRVGPGYDLALTELIDADRHVFLVEVATQAGASALRGAPTSAASEEDRRAAAAVVEDAAGRMGREMDTRDVKDLLRDNAEHPRWSETAERCLTCGNCTMACPTCFCTTTVDATDLEGAAARERVWDSCFSLEFSELGDGYVRSSGASRYRQWLTHKLATWIDQFGEIGCVGCGRCITWCPVGIDITEEVAAIRAEAHAEAQP